MIELSQFIRFEGSGLASAVMMPIMVFILAVLLKAPKMQAFRSAIWLGAGFIGVGLILNLLWAGLSTAGANFSSLTGLQRDVVDVGWPAAAAIGFSSFTGLWGIPMALGLNILLIKLKLTRTLNVDIWNFWHFAFVGTLITQASGNVMMGLVSMGLAIVFCLHMADRTAKKTQGFYGIDGISVPHLASVQIWPIAWIVNGIIERIPGLRSINWNADGLVKFLGPIVQPMSIGLILGGGFALCGLVSGASDGLPLISLILQIMVLVAGILLLPRMAQILMEGLAPLAEAARDLAEKQSEQQDAARPLQVGLDSAILTGHPAILAAAFLLVPIGLILSVILPFNRVILFTDLAVLPFVIALAAPLVNGNVFRLTIIGTIMLAMGFYFGTDLAGVFADAAKSNGFGGDNNSGLTAIVDGFLWPVWAAVRVVSYYGWLGMAVMAGLIGLSMLQFHFKKED